MDLPQFHEDFLQSVFGKAEAIGEMNAEAFFDEFTTHLVDSGDAPSAERAFYWNQQRGVRVDGYGGDPLDSGGTLTLFIQEFSDDLEIQTLTRGDLQRIFRRLLKFLTNARKTEFLDQLEETSPAFGLAFLINRQWHGIDRIRMILISNKKLSGRIDGMQGGELDGVEVTYNVWDLERLFNFAMSGREREEIIIDFEREYGGVLPVLQQNSAISQSFASYLAVIPGQQLSEIYDKWGTRLFEQNVRVFLQSRGAVNKGIRRTIEHEPERFLAYNNGLSATAEQIELVSDGGVPALRRIRNMQIVNGAQTTAAIHAARKDFPEQLRRINVQLKITIVPHERVEDVVPKISEYANSQNRVTAADFFSNHPYHVRIEEFSRRKYVAGSDGSFRQSKWFYERARGQYNDARGQKTPAERKRFDLEYPKAMLLTKTDWAKYQNTFKCEPHIVSRGAQKNFAAFAQSISKGWEVDSDQFNELHFEAGIAKAILFRLTERIVSAQPWYEGGYRANIVTYGLAKLVHDMAQVGRELDYESIWGSQEVSSLAQEAITTAAYSVVSVLTSEKRGHKNVTEWAKQEDCWLRAKQLQVDWSENFVEDLPSREQGKDNKRRARKEQKVDNDVKAQIAVVSAGAEFWAGALEWGMLRNIVSATEESLLLVARAMPAKIPTGPQSLKIISILERLQQEGFYGRIEHNELLKQ